MNQCLQAVLCNFVDFRDLAVVWLDDVLNKFMLKILHPIGIEQLLAAVTLGWICLEACFDEVLNIIRQSSKHLLLKNMRLVLLLPLLTIWIIDEGFYFIHKNSHALVVVEGGLASQENVGDDTDRPDVNLLAVEELFVLLE